MLLTCKAPLLCPKLIAICLTTGFIVAHQVYALDVPKLFMSYKNKPIGSTVLHVLDSQLSKISPLDFKVPFFYPKVP